MAKDNEEKQENNEKIWSDPRFAHLVNDPRFKGLPKSHKKVKIDKRFQSMFDNEKFKLKYSVDKRGRKVNTTTSEDLKKYYDLSSDETDEEEEKKKEQKAIEEQSDSEEEKEEVTNDEKTGTDEFGNSLLDRGDIAQDIKSKLKDLAVDYARGQ